MNARILAASYHSPDSDFVTRTAAGVVVQRNRRRLGRRSPPPGMDRDDSARHGQMARERRTSAGRPAGVHVLSLARRRPGETARPRRAVRAVAGRTRRVHRRGPVPESGFREVAHFKNLRFLQVSRSHVNKAGLKALATLPNLHTLYLDGTSRNRNSRSWLQSRVCRSIALNGDHAITHRLKELKHLKRIAFRLDDAPDEGLKALAGLANLHALSMSGKRVTANGMQHLANLTNTQPQPSQSANLRRSNEGSGQGQERAVARSRKRGSFGRRAAKLAGLENLETLNLYQAKMQHRTRGDRRAQEVANPEGASQQHHRRGTQGAGRSRKPRVSRSGLQSLARHGASSFVRPQEAAQLFA